MFNNKWRSENYPSSEDYKEAQRLGNVVKNRSFMDKPSSSEPDKPGFDGRSSTQAKKDKQKKSVENPRNIKGIVFIVAVLMGLLPNLSNILDQVTESLNLEALLPQESTLQDTLENSTLGTDVPHIQVAGEADYFRVNADNSSNPTKKTELIGFTNDASAWITASTQNGTPTLTLDSGTDQVDFLKISKFLKTAGAEFIFNSDGTLNQTASIELVFVDLTNDGLKDALLYFKGNNNGPYIELFYNDGSGVNGLSALDYYEIVEKIVITETGTIQRLDYDGNVADEIVIK